jgi:hypothetical protein
MRIKLARVLYHALLTKEPYRETVFHKCDEHVRRRAECSYANNPPYSLPDNSYVCRSGDGLCRAESLERILRKNLPR